MKEIDVKEIEMKPFKIFDKQWCLISAVKDDGSVNMMTASWGGVGTIWHKPVATVYIRPQRYTKELIDASDCFAINFMSEEYREVLNICGSKSGRDINKVEACGLTPVKEESVYFAEAETVFICKKLYRGNIKQDNFIDKSIIDRHYPKKDFHDVYIAEIIKAYKGE